MIETGTYTKAELSKFFGTTDTQGLKRKLQRYGITFQTSGRGNSLKFSITSTADPFKVFCIDELGYDGRTDFIKLRNFLYCYINDDEFRSMPDEVKAHRMQEAGKPMCRQTIANYISKLIAKDLIYRDTSEFLYYFAYKDTQRITTREEYASAWKLYWAEKDKGYDSIDAIFKMRAVYGGVARKQAVANFNGIYIDKINHLNTLICESIEKELI